MIQRNRRANIASPGCSYDLVLASRRETEWVGRTIGRLLQGGEVLALIGELGAGKTALVRGIAAGLGIPGTVVSSPTFTLVHQHPARIPLIHVDLYRLHSRDEAESIGLSDCFREHMVTAIEWADRFPTLLPEDRLVMRLTHHTARSRAIKFEAFGYQSGSLLTRLNKVLRAARSRTRSIHGRTPGNRKVTRR